MRVAVIQNNPKVGDISNNLYAMLDAYKAAAAAEVRPDLIVFPESAIAGYPLEDLVLDQSFLREVKRAADVLVAHTHSSSIGVPVIFGAPWLLEDRNINAAIVAQGGSCTVVAKSELPNYGVFDEVRTFDNSFANNTLFNIAGKKVGVMICEDCWFPKVSGQLAKKGADFLIAINGSPFEQGKTVTRRKVVAKRVRETGLPFLYVNLVGGQDELVFDGGSFAYDGHGVQEAPRFETGTTVFDLNIEGKITLDNYPMVQAEDFSETYRALVLGTRDYMQKQGFKSAVFGYSGGVDSGLAAAIACDAVGPENVNLVRLPSKYSSDHSLSDAAEGAERLKANLRTINIEPTVQAIRAAYGGTGLTGAADENAQARARGTILMAISNQEGHLLISTGNKSEVSVGYCTLYGDMNGGFNPLKDCYKTTVWALCRWRNGLTAEQIVEYGFKGNDAEVVPEAIIVKPPSAELRPDQKDSDSLPPYEELDAILQGLIERNERISHPEIDRVARLVRGAEFKRRQAAIGIKITSKLFGKERRYPIVNGYV